MASPGPVASRSQQVLSSILIRSEFQPAERKKTLLLCSPQGLALIGMGQGSESFSTRVRRLEFFLIKKRWGHTLSGSFFFYIKREPIAQFPNTAGPTMSNSPRLSSLFSLPPLHPSSLPPYLVRHGQARRCRCLAESSRRLRTLTGTWDSEDADKHRWRPPAQLSSRCSSRSAG